jgi:hypothetical protein
VSPFIRRIIVDEPQCSAGKLETPHEFYVPRRELLHGDIVLDPTVDDRDHPKFIRPEVLAGLAVQFPAEFGAAAKARAIAIETVATADAEDDDDDAGDDDLGPKAEEAGRIVKLTGAAITAAIGACEDVEVLAVLRELEEARARPRQAVLDALTAKGI